MFSTIIRYFSPVRHAPRLWTGLFFTNLWDKVSLVVMMQIGLYLMHAIEHGDQETMMLWIWILVAVFCSMYISYQLEQRLGELTDGHIGLGLERDYFEQFLHLDATYTDKIGTGKMQEIIFKGTDNLREIAGFTSIGLIVDIITIIYAFILLASQSPTRSVFFLLLGLFVASTLLVFLGLNVLYRTGLINKEIYTEISRYRIKILMHKFEVLQNNGFEKEMQKISDLHRKAKKNRIRGNFIKLLRQMGANIMIDGSQIVIYIVIGSAVMAGEYSFASFVLMLNLIWTMAKYVRSIRQTTKSLFSQTIHVKKLWDTFDNAPRIRERAICKDFVLDSGTVVFKNVSFGYDSEKKIFSDFDLILPVGSITALVGPSGGGKSTLMKMIAGYIAPQCGHVMIDGNDLADVYLPDYYRHIGYLTQEPSVFDGTVRENLEYGIGDGRANLLDLPNNDIANTNGNGNAKSVSLQDVLEKSQCQFVSDLPNGLDTEIGERGVRLSGGQRQRLAIAKIMLKNPKIILLDEPTSALDSVSEELVSQAMQELFKDRTVVIIAHRLQTVKHADRILYIEDGAIAEEGTHEELIVQGGKYAKMVEVQTGF